MIAANDPLIGMRAARKFGDDVIKRDDLPIEVGLEMHDGGAGADVISDGQCAAPRFRHSRAAQASEQRQRVAIRNRQDGNFQNRLGFFARETLGVLRCAYARRQRIARMNRHIHHAAALHALLRTPRALRINIALIIAIVFRI